MSAIDVAALLVEVAEDQPSGEDLEYDAAFTDLEIAAQGKDEQEIGDTVVEAEEPDWAEVQETALAVLNRSKDLRAAMHLTRALLRRDGFSGLNQALELIRGYVEQYWETVHPQLDPDDDNDPTMRVNALSSLTHKDTMLRALRDAPLTDSRVVGRFCLHDIAIAKGELPPPDQSEDPPAEMATISAAFQDTDPEWLQAQADAVRGAIEHAASIDAAVTEKIGAGASTDMSDLHKALKEARAALNEHLGGEDDEGDAEGMDADGGGALAMDGDAAGGPVSGVIRNTNDVVRTLDKIIDYYARSEPSSPVPLLLHRARRLVSQDFMTIMKDIAPDGVHQAKIVGGVKENDD